MALVLIDAAFTQMYSTAFYITLCALNGENLAFQAQ